MIAAPEGTYGLFRPGRTLTVNAVYSKHWRTRQKAVATYRAEFADIIRRSPIPYLTVVGVEAIPYYRGGQIPDVGACLPAVKAAVDALVDTGRLPDDDSRYVRWLRFHAPEVGEWDGLLVAVRPLDEEESGGPSTDDRNPHCVEAWPDCVDGGYHPNCSRFPKSCSCGPGRPSDEVGPGKSGASDAEPYLGVPHDVVTGTGGDSTDHERDDGDDEQDDVPSEFHGGEVPE